MNILEKIVAQKRVWIAEQQSKKSVEELKQSLYYERPTISLVNKIRHGKEAGIIAEFKRRSPSKGDIYANADVVEVVSGYQTAKASAVSILTDVEFFGGSDKDLLDARPHLTIPILRKDFIINTYQIHEAKAIGADIILLIAACLSVQEVKELSQLAKSLGLEVLLELHDEDELGHVSTHIDFVGINNRSLKTFEVNVKRSLIMASSISNSYIKVAESGIDDPALVRLFKENGFGAFLIGEYFMKTQDPGPALEKFIQQI
jgi:indole-3-glycerol phosphate synthase